MSASASALGPFNLLKEVEEAEDVLILCYSASLEVFERFALGQARASQARASIIADARMVTADPAMVRRAGLQYLDARAVCGTAAFHPKLLAIVGQDNATLAIGSGNLTISGWHADAEIWTVLRADGDGAPTTFSQVSGFLRALSRSAVQLSTGAAEVLERVGARMDTFGATLDGPRLASSLGGPIIDDLPAGPVDELIAYAPFHDPDLAGLTAVVDRLQPASLTVFVQRETEVDGQRLESFLAKRGGRIAWLTDHRYHHGKLLEWSVGGARYALTGSPNLSRRALLMSAEGGGNLELALIGPIADSLRPEEVEPLKGGLAALVVPPHEAPDATRPLLLGVRAEGDLVILTLSAPLGSTARVQVYDRAEDTWRSIASLSPGESAYTLPLGGFSPGTAVRVFVEADQAVSNEVFVADLARLAQRPLKAIGRAMTTPAGLVAGDGLDLLLMDIDELRPHLLRIGAMVAAGTGDERPRDPEKATPRPGQSLEDYIAACALVLGEPLVEWALVLPSLPFVTTSIDHDPGVLTSEEGDGAVALTAERPAVSLQQEIGDLSDHHRARLRRFCEGLIARAEPQPHIVRLIAARMALHGIAARLWARQAVWERVLVDAATALGAPGDEPRADERAAAASVGAVILAVLCAQVPKHSDLDEHALNFNRASAAITSLLNDFDPERVATLAADLEDGFGSLVSPDRVFEVACEAQDPEHGQARALRLLSDDYELRAQDREGAIEFVLELPLIPERPLLLAVGLAGAGDDPVVAMGRNPKGTVTAVWRAPWLAIDHGGPRGHWGSLYRLGGGADPFTVATSVPGGDVRESLPEPTERWMPGQEPSETVRLLLSFIPD